MSSSLLIFLKVNFSADIGDFDSTIAEEEGFSIYKGFNKGPDNLESGLPVKVSTARESTSIGLPDKPAS